MKEKDSKLSALLQASHLQPNPIRLDEGKAYTISHPDFALVADGALVLAHGPGIDLGGARFVICYFEHITRVEVLKRKAKAAA